MKPTRLIGPFTAAPAARLGGQLPLMVVELVYGMHIHHHLWNTPLPGRLAGLFISPNSFGVFAVVALAFCHAFSPSRAHFLFLSIAATLIVALSGSATGWI